MPAPRVFALLLTCCPLLPATAALADVSTEDGRVTITPAPVTFELPPQWIHGPQHKLASGAFVGMFGRQFVAEDGSVVIPACTFLAVPDARMTIVAGRGQPDTEIIEIHISDLTTVH